jgi:predicted nucleic acid-binding protein
MKLCLAYLDVNYETWSASYKPFAGVGAPGAGEAPERREIVILLDTSVLIDSLTGPKRSAPALRKAIERGERILLPSLVLYEWLRGPRLPEELAAQEALFPSESAVPFTAQEASRSARLYSSLRRPRGREIDIAIAACAIVRQAELWTLNPSDFHDILGLHLTTPLPK